MIYDLKRSVEQRWLFDHRCHIHFRWSCLTWQQLKSEVVECIFHENSWMACFASISLQLNYRNSRICTTTHHSNKFNVFQKKLKFRTKNMAHGENQDFCVHKFDKNRRTGGGTRKPFRFSAAINFKMRPHLLISSYQSLRHWCFSDFQYMK